MKNRTREIKGMLKDAELACKNLYMVNPIDGGLIRIVDVKTKCGLTAVRSLNRLAFGMILDSDKFVIQ